MLAMEYGSSHRSVGERMRDEQKNPTATLQPPEAKQEALHGRLSSCFSTELNIIRGWVATESHARA
jgi:hypothetical protein